jgi:hypothetical protein
MIHVSVTVNGRGVTSRARYGLQGHTKTTSGKTYTCQKKYLTISKNILYMSVNILSHAKHVCWGKNKFCLSSLSTSFFLSFITFVILPPSLHSRKFSATSFTSLLLRHYFLLSFPSNHCYSLLETFVPRKSSSNMKAIYKVSNWLLYVNLGGFKYDV